MRALNRYGLNRRGAPVFVQSFEQDNLRALDPWLKVPLVQLLDAPTLRPAANPANPTYGELATPAGLRSIARYAEGVGPSKDYIVPRDAAGRSLPPTSFVRDAHAAGLKVHPYTFRRENQFLPLELRSSDRPQRDRRPEGGDPAVLRARRRRRVHRQPRHRRRGEARVYAAMTPASRSTAVASSSSER